MNYELDTIKKSQEIFYYLLRKHEISEIRERELFRTFAENEEIQILVKSQAEIAGSSVERYGDTIYLIPDEENVYREFKNLLINKEEYAKISKTSNPYGDGNACKRIADVLEEYFSKEEVN